MLRTRADHRPSTRACCPRRRPPRRATRPRSGPPCGRSDHRAMGARDARGEQDGAAGDESAVPTAARREGRAWRSTVPASRCADTCAATGRFIDMPRSPDGDACASLRQRDDPPRARRGLRDWRRSQRHALPTSSAEARHETPREQRVCEAHEVRRIIAPSEDQAWPTSPRPERRARHARASISADREDKRDVRAPSPVKARSPDRGRGGGEVPAERGRDRGHDRGAVTESCLAPSPALPNWRAPPD